MQLHIMKIYNILRIKFVTKNLNIYYNDDKIYLTILQLKKYFNSYVRKDKEYNLIKITIFMTLDIIDYKILMQLIKIVLSFALSLIMLI